MDNISTSVIARGEVFKNLATRKSNWVDMKKIWDSPRSLDSYRVANFVKNVATYALIFFANIPVLNYITQYPASWIAKFVNWCSPPQDKAPRRAAAAAAPASSSSSAGGGNSARAATRAAATAAAADADAAAASRPRVVPWPTFRLPEHRVGVPGFDVSGFNPLNAEVFGLVSATGSGAAAAGPEGFSSTAAGGRATGAGAALFGGVTRVNSTKARKNWEKLTRLVKKDIELRESKSDFAKEVPQELFDRLARWEPTE